MNKRPQLRLLIVDDSSNMRRIIRTALQDHFDFEFLEASNGEEGLSLIQESHVMGTPIDIVFLDWMMPKLSGYELLKSIRESEVFCEKPQVIMLTAETYSHQLNAASRYNVSSYITKPFEADEIITAVKKALEERRLAHAV